MKYPYLALLMPILLPLALISLAGLIVEAIILYPFELIGFQPIYFWRDLFNILIEIIVGE